MREELDQLILALQRFRESINSIAVIQEKSPIDARRKRMEFVERSGRFFKSIGVDLKSMSNGIFWDTARDVVNDGVDVSKIDLTSIVWVGRNKKRLDRLTEKGLMCKPKI